MAIPSFFKQTKPRGFNYTPRYYDPAKEEMEQRRRELKWEREAAEGDHAAADSGNEEGNYESEATGNEKVAAGRSGHSSLAGTVPGSSNQPYRSKIMRGDMRTHFHRRQEKVRKQTTIRLLVIILIIVLFVYFYLRF